MNALVILTVNLIIAFVLSGCTTAPAEFVEYKPKNDVIIKEKIVYRGGGDTEDKARSEYAKQKDLFSFKAAKRNNYNSYALVIGISNYNENTNVDYADFSALAFEDLLKNTYGIPSENIITLLNSKASSGQIKAKIELVKELAENGTSLYVYFAGHGVPGKDGATYLLPADMSADSIHLEPNLKLDAIYEKLEKSLASKVHIFIDSCFSGKDDGGKLLYKGVAPVLKSKGVSVNSKKLTIFTAGNGSDFANEYSIKKHRLFTYHLIRELSGGSGSLSDVYSNIRRNVKRESLLKGIGYKQVPQLYGNTTASLY